MSTKGTYLKNILYTDEYIASQFNKLSEKERLQIVFKALKKESSKDPLISIAEIMGYVRADQPKKYIKKKEMVITSNKENTTL